MEERMFRFRNLLKVLLAGLLLVLVSGAPTANAGEAAVNFTLRDINGKQVSLADFKGKVVLLSFWATWCGPCKVEMAHLSEMYKELKDQGFVVLSISSDDARSASQVKPYIKRKRYTFPVVLDKESAITATYNPTKTLPYGVLVGKDFTVSKRYSGYNPGDEVKVKKDVVAELAK
jgi:peroxiredoxin